MSDKKKLTRNGSAGDTMMDFPYTNIYERSLGVLSICNAIMNDSLNRDQAYFFFFFLFVFFLFLLFKSRGIPG